MPMTAKGRAMLTCPVCGVRTASAWVYFEAMLYMADRRKARKYAPRWPHRDRAAAECPECGEKVVFMTWVSRDCLEMS